MFNFGALKYEIKEQFGTQGEFAKALGINDTRMSHLLSGKAKWDNEMIYKAAQLLGLEGDAWEYFFTPKSHKKQEN